MSTHAAVQGAANRERQSIVKVAGASLVGTTLEFYNHFIDGLVAS